MLIGQSSVIVQTSTEEGEKNGGRRGKTKTNRILHHQRKKVNPHDRDLLHGTTCMEDYNQTETGAGRQAGFTTPTAAAAIASSNGPLTNATL